MTPVGDPYEALVSMGQPGNVDTVVVDGRVTRLDHARIVRDAREAAMALHDKANWPT